MFSFVYWLRRFLSPPDDELGFVVKERYIIRGANGDKCLFYGTSGWVDDRECASVFIRRDAAELTRCRLGEDGCDKITDVSVERIDIG